MPCTSNYPTEVPAELANLLATSQHQQQQIDREKHNKPNLWDMIRFKLKAAWTYHTNAIEGNVLSLGDTIFFLQEGLTVQGKPLQDHYTNKIKYSFAAKGLRSKCAFT